MVRGRFDVQGAKAALFGGLLEPLVDMRLVHLYLCRVCIS